MCEVIGWEDAPAGGSHVWLPGLWYSICRQVPHLRVPFFYVLFHTQESSLGLIFAIMHVAKLGEIGLNVLHSMRTPESTSFLAFFASTLELNLGFRAVTYVGFFLPDELLSQLVELLEVVTGICDFAGREVFVPVLTGDFDNDWGERTQPFDDLQDPFKVNPLLLIGVCVVVSYINCTCYAISQSYDTPQNLCHCKLQALQW